MKKEKRKGRDPSAEMVEASSISKNSNLNSIEGIQTMAPKNSNSKIMEANGNNINDTKRKEIKRSKKKKKNEHKGLGSKVEFNVQYGDIEANSTFESFNFDERLLKAVGEIGWRKPTQVQQNLIPLILEGKNVTARGRTGSGKTGAFMLPIIQKVVQLTNTLSEDIAGPFALFITPSKELSSQTFKLLQQLTATFPFLLSMNYAEADFLDEEVWLKEKPDMLVSTPSRLLLALRRNGDLCAGVKYIVLDEADLLLSYGYEDEMKQIRTFLPPRYQTVFTSATLSDDIGLLKEIFISGPVVTLKLKEGQLPNTDQLSQYHINCQNDEERFAIFLALIKLKLLIGKTIIFVRDTNRCYQLGLFLQAFQIRSCILNSNMPVNSRCHVVHEFNEGRYNYLIASSVNDAFLSNSPMKADKKSINNISRKARGKIDKESDVSRGIDFYHVSNVVNFDFPTSTEIYIHRAGRTARGWNKGTVLSFTSEEEKKYLEIIHDDLKKQMGDEVIIPYEIRLKELDSFFLRTREALTACTKNVVREARLAEIREEILRSKKLEGYFVKNPREKASLEHDKKLQTLSLHSPGIADVPDYIVPPSLRNMNYQTEDRLLRRKESNKRKRSQRPRVSRIRYKRKLKDPLQSFSF